MDIKPVPVLIFQDPFGMVCYQRISRMNAVQIEVSNRFFRKPAQPAIEVMELTCISHRWLNNQSCVVRFGLSVYTSNAELVRNWK